MCASKIASSRQTTPVGLPHHVILCFMVLTQVVRLQACPTVCTCSGTSVDCTYQSLSVVPIDIPSDTETLDLRNNQFTSLPGDAFVGLSSLRLLYLDSSGFTSIDSGAFNGLTVLEELTLSSNEIASLPDSVFSAIGPSLTKLDLKSNKLASISAATFAGLSSLANLDLSSNELTTLPDDGFADLATLSSLDLSSNLLTSISARSFNGLSSLPLLNLDSNDITTIDAGALSPMTSLTKFSAVGNSLTTIPVGLFSDHSTLEEIDLQDNQLGALETSMFSNLPNIRVIKLRSNQIASVGVAGTHAFFGIKASIRKIDLSDNLLTQIVQFHFISLTALEEIDLSENRITSVANGFFSCNSLEVVNLKQNLITTIDSLVFGIQSLVTVDLSHNQLTEVPTDAFQTTGSTSLVENIYLNDNQITTVLANAFQYCPNLRVVILKRNVIATLTPSAFSSLEQLRSIDLSSNLITDVPTNTFEDLVRLETINLKQNSLETVQSGAFTNLENLLELDLAHNVIHTIESGAFDTLTVLATLSLNDNRLTVVPKSAIETIASLVTLDLSSNIIEALAESKSFGELDNLQTLLLHNNSITSVSEDCFGGLLAAQNITLDQNSISIISEALSTSDTLSQLIYISLKENSITGIESIAFTGFSALETVDLSHNMLSTLNAGIFDDCKATISDLRLQNNSLVCDCNLEWLISNFSTVISGGVCSSPSSLSERPLFGSNGVAADEVCPLTTTTTTTTEATTIVEPVTILTPEQEITVKVNTVVELPCVATGIPIPTISWTDSSRTEISSVGIYSVDLTTGTLTINGITDTMAGYYICTASNSLGDSATVNIRVWVLFAPYITNFVDAVMVSDQLEYYSLPCDVNAYPAATFEWSVPDTSSVDVFETGSVIMTSTGTLYFSTPAEASTGYYNCTASNSEGSVWRESFAFIYNATENVSPITVEVQEGGSVVLSAPSVYSETGFIWLLPSGSYIVSSVHIRSTLGGTTSGTESDTTTQSGGSDNSDNSDSTTESPDATSDSGDTNGNGGDSNGVTAATGGSSNGGDTTTSGAGASTLISTAYTSESQLNYTNANLSSAYSIDTLTGALTINAVASSADGTFAGATVGEYKLQSAHGTVSFIVRIDDNSSVTDVTTTVDPSDNVSALGNGSSIAVSYYVVLGAILIFIITMFLLRSYVCRKNKKKPQYRTESFITPDNTKQF